MKYRHNHLRLISSNRCVSKTISVAFTHIWTVQISSTPMINLFDKQPLPATPSMKERKKHILSDSAFAYVFTFCWIYNNSVCCVTFSCSSAVRPPDYLHLHNVFFFLPLCSNPTLMDTLAVSLKMFWAVTILPVLDSS